MTYRFKLQEPVADGIRRIALKQIEIAEAKLASVDDTPTAIHDARRCLKRLRALIRLMRPGLDETIYQQEVARLVGIGKLLSGARDRHVMRQTVAKLETRFGALANGGGARLRKLLAQGPGGDERVGADGRRAALSRLKQARRLFAGKATDGVALEHILEGLEVTYRKARRAFRKAYRKPSDDSFHAWRKAAQLHWRHMLLLSRGWPEVLSARASEAKELSRLLGEDHDHSVLIVFVEGQAASALSARDIASLTERSRSCQSELRAWAEPRGERLFAERPENLKERISLYWSSARCLSGLMAAEEPSSGAPADAPVPAVKVKRVRRAKR